MQLGNSAIETVMATIDSMEEEIVRLTAALVQRQSVNPNYPASDCTKYLGGEKSCNQYLEKYLRDFGCKTELFEKASERTNLVARLEGKGGGKSLILSGHIDTVPFGKEEDWQDDPLSGKVKEGKLFGRGSCDMKGGIASMCCAAAAINRAGLSLKGHLILESVVGEETMDHLLGTTATVERGYKADAAIITEPTSLHLQPVTTGVILLKVKVTGKATHATARDMMIRAGGGGDEVGVNAIEKGVKVIQLLQALETQWGITKKHPLFNPGHFVIHPGTIDGAPHGHRYVAVVPDYCEIDYAILYDPAETPEQVQKEITEYLTTGTKLDTWLSRHPPKLEWKGVWPSGEISPEHPICKVVAAAHSRAHSAQVVVDGFPAPMDAPFLDQAGIPTAVFGPGNLPQAHSENEYVEVQQLVKATKTLVLTIMQWCGVSEY